MDDHQLERIIALAERIAIALESLARGSAPEELNLVKPIDEFTDFDWSSINATVIQQDRDGPTHLEWGGYVWTRRSPSNKFSPAIWFSRPAGKDPDGNVHYLRLITFKAIGEAEPVPAKITQTKSISAPGPVDQPRAAAALSAPPADDPGIENDFQYAPGEKEKKQIDATRYYSEAGSKRFNLSREWAIEIAKLVGIDLAVKASSFTAAYKLLPYFAEAKALGMDLDTARQMLRAHQMDPQEAILRIREKLAPR